MRAFLFARATAAMWGWERAARRPNQLCAARGGCSCICRSTERAPRMSSVRRYRSPRLLILRRRVLPPEESWRGTRPNQAASCRPFLKARTSPMSSTHAGDCAVQTRTDHTRLIIVCARGRARSGSWRASNFRATSTVRVRSVGRPRRDGRGCEKNGRPASRRP